MKIDPKALGLAQAIAAMNEEQLPGEGHIATDLARAYLALAAQAERWAPVVEAAREWQATVYQQAIASTVPWLGEGVGSLRNIFAALSTAKAGQP